MSAWTESVERDAAWCGRVRVTRWPVYLLRTDRVDVVPPAVVTFTDTARLVYRVADVAEVARG
jgi:hypothetical protein